MGFETSVSDLDLGLVFAEVAAVSDSQATRTRNLANACDIYLQFRDEPCAYPVGNWQRAEIETRLGKLRRNLEAFRRGVWVIREARRAARSLFPFLYHMRHLPSLTLR